MANSPSAKNVYARLSAAQQSTPLVAAGSKTFVRKVEEAIASGDADAAKAALKAAQPEIMRGATKGVTHRNTASRKVSRLAARVKAVGA